LIGANISSVGINSITKKVAKNGMNLVTASIPFASGILKIAKIFDDTPNCPPRDINGK